MFAFGMFNSPRRNSLSRTTSIHETKSSESIESSSSLFLQKGGHGEVFKENENNNSVAIKRPCNPDTINDWMFEVVLHAALSHPNIVQFIEYDLNPVAPFLKLEFINGGDLLETLNTRNLSLNEIIIILQGILSGLEYLHHEQILHRDIKSENVLIQWKNNRCEAKLCDFGFAIPFRKEQNFIEDSFMGTPIHVAPEIIEHGHYSKNSDIYAAAAIIGYILATKNYLFPDILNENNNWNTLLMLKKDENYLNTQLAECEKNGIQTPKYFVDLIRAANHPNPTKRPSATQLLKFPLFVAPEDSLEPTSNRSSPERTFY
ncbi:MAG: serine/threonine-protein kinase [Legionellaceae bacterium]|nr:serine/threonine-protein kinase [Legionellaceae bacterium]